MTLLAIEGLTVRYEARRSLLGGRPSATVAVDELDLALDSGEVLALVGESGSGKSSTARALLRLIPASKGRVLYEPPEDDLQADAELARVVERFGSDGRVDLLRLPDPAMRVLRRSIQVVFQNPAASLDPRMSIGRTIAEPLEIHCVGTDSERRERVLELLERVGLEASLASRLPHELSGGQQQRVGIARALALGPRLLVCDEVVSALDVSVQAQILDLLQELQRTESMSYLFISHDLAVVAEIADRTAVLKAGQVVEVGETASLLAAPSRSYTRSLLAAIPPPPPVPNRH